MLQNARAPLRFKYVFSLFFLFLAAGGSILSQGFEFGTGTNAFHISSIFNYADSVEGPNDLFHQTFKRYFSGYWVVVSLFTTEENLPNVFLSLHVLFRILNIFVIWQITKLLGVPGKLAAVICGLMLFFPSLTSVSPIGSNSYQFVYLNQSESVAAFALFVFYLTMQKRFIWAAAVVSMAFSVNAFIGVWCGVVTGLTMIYYYRNENKAFIAIKAVQMMGVFILLSIPMLIWIYNSMAMTGEYTDYDLIKVIRLTFPHHHFIDTHLPKAMAALIIIFASYFSFDLMGKKWNAEHRTLLKSIFIILVAIIIFGIFLPYITDNRFLLSLFPLRMDKYLILLNFIFVISWCVQSINSSDPVSRILPLVAFLSLINGNAALFLVSLAFYAQHHDKSNIYKIAVVFLFLTGLCHWITGVPIIFERVWGGSAVVVAMIQIGLFLTYFSKHKEYLSYAYLILTASILGIVPETINMVSGVSLFASYLLLICGVFLRKKFPLYSPLLSVLCVMCLLPLYYFGPASKVWFILLVLFYCLPILIRYAAANLSTIFIKLNVSISTFPYILFSMMLTSSAYTYLERGGIYAQSEEFLPFLEAQEWARKNTPPHTLFLPIGEKNFSTLSRRPVWVDQKLGETAFWAPEVYPVWIDRYEQVRDINTIAAAQHLAQKENIEYIVFKRSLVDLEPQYEDCIVFENDYYWIMNRCQD